MKRMQLFILIIVSMVVVGGSTRVSAQSSASPALTKSLQDVYLYWRKSMIEKNYKAWSAITAEHRRIAIQNRILSAKGEFPADIFRLPSAPPNIAGLKLLRARTKNMTAKLVYFGKIDFGVGGDPTDNLLVLSFLHEGRGWKYDSAEFVSLSGLQDVRKQLQAGNYKYVDGAAFMPEGVRPRRPVVVNRAKYIAEVYSFCPGREVKVTVNGVSSHRFQNDKRSEIVIGGVKDGFNQIQYSIKNLPGYTGNDAMTVRVYLFSQIEGVKPVKVFQYQTVDGEKPKATGVGTFNIGRNEILKIMGR